MNPVMDSTGGYSPSGIACLNINVNQRGSEFIHYTASCVNRLVNAGYAGDNENVHKDSFNDYDRIFNFNSPVSYLNGRFLTKESKMIPDVYKMKNCLNIIQYLP